MTDATYLIVSVIFSVANVTSIKRKNTTTIPLLKNNLLIIKKLKFKCSELV